jgi:hypothetical protein
MHFHFPEGAFLFDFITTPFIIKPFFPFSDVQFDNGWYWQNFYIFLVTNIIANIIVLLLVFIVMFRKNITPLELVSPRYDKLFLGFFTYPGKHICVKCNGKAYYKCESCGKYFCDKHMKRLFAFKCPLCAERHQIR